MQTNIALKDKLGSWSKYDELTVEYVIYHKSKGYDYIIWVHENTYHAFKPDVIECAKHKRDYETWIKPTIGWNKFLAL